MTTIYNYNRYNEGSEVDEAFLVAAIHGNLEEIKRLLSEGANLHYMDDNALLYSVDQGHLGVVQYLLSLGAGEYAIDFPPITIAAGNGDLDILKELVKYGADLQRHGVHCLESSIAEDQLEVVEYLFQQGCTTNYKKRNNAVICEVVRNNQFEMLELLTKYGLDIKEMAKQFLQFSCTHYSMETCEYLIKNSDKEFINSNSIELLKKIILHEDLKEEQKKILLLSMMDKITSLEYSKLEEVKEFTTEYKEMIMICMKKNKLEQELSAKNMLTSKKNKI